jgi:hypothetical protein
LERENDTDDQPIEVTLEVPDESGGGFLADIELSPVDGVIACVSLRIRSYARDDGEAADYELIGVQRLSSNEREITASLVRSLSVRKLIDSAIAHVRSEALFATHFAESIPSTFESWLKEAGFANLDPRGQLSQEEQSQLDWARTQYALEKSFYGGRAKRAESFLGLQPSVQKKTGRPRISDSVLQEVADLYDQALQWKERAPAKHVARSLDIAHGRARRWVMYARQRGFLPPTVEGVPRGRSGQTGEKE